MSKNSLGQIQVYRHAAAAAAVAFSLQDTGAFLSQIPAGVPGTTMTLPKQPNDGDSYTFWDTDGTCSENNVVAVQAATDGSNTATIQGLTVQVFISPYSACTFTYNEDANDWVMSVAATAARALQSNGITTAGFGGPVAPGDVATGTATPFVLLAIPIEPKAVGIFDCALVLNFTLSAADTVKMELFSQADVTAVAGGASFGSVALEASYETGTGGGQPVVVTGGALVSQGAVTEQVAAGQIAAQTLTWSNAVRLPFPTDPTTEKAALVVKLSAAGGAHFSAMKLSVTFQEKFS